MPDEELERFKREIRLHEYAAFLGYELDQRDSSRREVVMRRADDKISVRMDADGHYVYYSFRNAKDNGTIVDFAMSRQNKTMGEARKALRLWGGAARIPLYEPLEAARRFDRNAVLAEYRAMKDLHWHHWLEQERALPRPVLLSPRFNGRIKVDGRANVIFPHEDETGVCGFEKRNRFFKGFADLGRKSLWRSAHFDGDAQLVIGESAIDCLSHAALFPAPHARYASFAGGMSEDQVAFLAKECRGLPEGSEVVCITHPDANGKRYAEIILSAAGPLPFRLHQPSGVKDWNDYLQQARVSRLHSFPAVR